MAQGQVFHRHLVDPNFLVFGHHHQSVIHSAVLYESCFDLSRKSIKLRHPSISSFGFLDQLATSMKQFDGSEALASLTVILVRTEFNI
jgi:hypothetical protein